MDRNLLDTPCPLCRHEEMVRYHADQARTYLSCDHCSLVFVPGCHWLSPEDEKAVYDLHQNDPQDLGYRRFLSRLTTPLLERVGPATCGLDFGCGPGPALSRMLEEKGHRMDLFDPIYHCDPAVFSKSYDFICATEVVEHLRRPDQEFSALFRMLKSGGWLGIMTKLVIDQAAFQSWHYIRDLTHICFYSQATFDYIAGRFNAEVFSVAKDVILLKKM